MDNMDLLLKEAFEEMVTQEYENRPLDFPEHRFSLKFRIKMYRLIHRIGVKEKDSGEKTSILELYRPIRSTRRLLLLVALILLLLGGTVVAAKTLICWLYQITLEQREDHVKVNENESIISEDELIGAEGNFRKYKLTKLPEGYILMEEMSDEIFKERVEVYKNIEGYFLLFKQSGQGGITIGNVTSDREKLEEITIDDFKGYYMEDDNVGSILLSDEHTLIELSGRFSKEELIALVEEMVPIE